MDKVEMPVVSDDGSIKFYNEDDPNGEFSNFYPSPITIDEKQWPTTEHYFQGIKFKGTEKEEIVRKADSPAIALRLGRERNPAFPLRPDWEQIKDEVMYTAIKAKFTQHKELYNFLLATNNCYIIEHTQNDSYWGDGGDGSGENKLGILFMQLRDELRGYKD